MPWKSKDSNRQRSVESLRDSQCLFVGFVGEGWAGILSCEGCHFMWSGEEANFLLRHKTYQIAQVLCIGQWLTMFKAHSLHSQFIFQNGQRHFWTCWTPRKWQRIFATNVISSRGINLSEGYLQILVENKQFSTLSFFVFCESGDNK